MWAKLLGPEEADHGEEEMNAKLSFFLITTTILALGLLGVCHGGPLKQNYYKHTCPQALKIVRKVTWKHVAQDLTLAAPLLRLHFHDCFVRGCDASVLLESTASNKAEKDAFPDLTLGGFDVIADIKAAVEKKCPGVVSCADIVALAARDSVAFQYKRSLWKVLLGRRDGTVSHMREVLANIPPPSFNFTQLKHLFASKGLNVHDLVVLSGAHTIGDSHCFSFDNRLYNFTGKGYGQDPTDPRSSEWTLEALGRQNHTRNGHPRSSLSFDTHYYKMLLQKKGLFQSDVALLTDKEAYEDVLKMLYTRNFFEAFGPSIRRMGYVQVLTGTEGEIRRNCSLVNS